MSDIPLAESFQFDNQGFIVLRGVLSAAACSAFRDELDRLFARDYADPWLAEGLRGQTTVQLSPGQRRINGLPLWSSAFDAVIAQPDVLARLRAWMQHPQLVNTWAIDKTESSPWGSWHRGIQPDDYSYYHGRIRTRMLNTVWFLTENGPDDGCLIVVPGSHKSNLQLDLRDYRERELPGALRVTGQPGDVVLFAESLLHTGAPKTGSRPRTNLYFNYIDATYNVAMRELIAGIEGNINHYCFPPEVRGRFGAEALKITEWMEWQRLRPARPVSGA